MKRFNSIALAVALLAFTANSMSANDPQRVGQYDFGYQVTGDFRARPIQVFDDGVAKTYFQFRPGEPIPVVMVGEGQKILFPRAEGPYYVVDGIARDYSLAMGMSRGRAVHASVIAGVVKPSEAVAAQATAVGSQKVLLASATATLPEGTLQRLGYAQPSPESRNDWTANSYATPLRGDSVQWQSEQPREATVAFSVGESKVSQEQLKALAALARSAGTSTRVEVIGADDESMRERLPIERAEAIKAVLVRAGVPPQNVAILQPRAIAATRVVGKRRVVDSIVRWYPMTAMAVPALAQQPVAPAAANVSETGVKGLSSETVRLLLARNLISKDQAAKMLVATRSSETPARAVREAMEWDLRRIDGTMSSAVKRWGRSAGYEVVWDTSVDAPITGEAVVAAADFKGAVSKVMEGLQKAGYPIKARVYSDNVVRFFSE